MFRLARRKRRAAGLAGEPQATRVAVVGAQFGRPLPARKRERQLVFCPGNSPTKLREFQIVRGDDGKDLRMTLEKKGIEFLFIDDRAVGISATDLDQKLKRNE